MIKCVPLDKSDNMKIEVRIMLHNESRELLVEAFEKHHNARDIADVFSVSLSSVYRLAAQKQKTGSVKLQTNLRGRKSILDSKDRENISHLIESRPDITVDEIREKLSLKASYATIERAILDMGYSRKKKSLYASERERLRCQKQTS